MIEVIDQRMKGVVQAADVVALTQHTSDIACAECLFTYQIARSFPQFFGLLAKFLEILCVGDLGHLMCFLRFINLDAQLPNLLAQGFFTRVDRPGHVLEDSP